MVGFSHSVGQPLPLLVEQEIKSNRVDIFKGKNEQEETVILILQKLELG